MKVLYNNLNLVSLIEEYTYFFVKKQYKTYCRENSIKFIEKKNLEEVIKNLLINKFDVCKKFVLDKISFEYTLTDNNIKEINDIFIDIKEDTTEVSLQIKNIINEFQIKKGFYDE